MRATVARRLRAAVYGEALSPRSREYQLSRATGVLAAGVLRQNHQRLKAAYVLDPARAPHGLNALVAFVLLAAVARADVQPSMSTADQCSTFTLCDAQTEAGDCSADGLATGDPLVLSRTPYTSWTFYSGRSTAASYSCEVFEVRNGATAPIFQVNEGVSGPFSTVYGDFVVSDGWPGSWYVDHQFPASGNEFPASGNALFNVSCTTDNDCGCQFSNESGTADARVGMLAVRTNDAGASTLYLGGVGQEGEETVPDNAITVDEAGVLQGRGTGHVDIQSVESSGIGALAISGSDICWDIDANGCDDGDPNLTQNAPTNTNGDETVQGILTVVDEFRVTGIPEPLEDTLYSFRTASGSGAIPDNDWCYPMFGYATAPIAGRGSDPSGSCEHPLATDLQLTQMCVTFVVGTAPTNNCVLQLYEKGERGTVHASFDVGGTEMDTVGETKCVALNVPIDDAPESLYFQASATANDCDATTNWPELEVLVRGYRVTIP